MVAERGSIALGKGDGERLEEVADGGRLLLFCVAGKGAAQLLDLADGRLVTKDDALCIARLPGLVELPFVCNGESMTWGLSSLSNKGCLNGDRLL